MPRRPCLPLVLTLALAACLPTPSPTPTLPPVPTATIPPTVTPPQRPPTLTPMGLPTLAPSETPPPSPAITDTPLPPGVIPTAGPLAIKAFSAEPARVQPGEVITLTWDVEAETIVIQRLDPQGKLAETYDVLTPPPLLIPTGPDWRERVNFVLVATAGAATAQAFLSVDVACGADEWYFLDPPDVCPGSALIVGLAANQPFERGRMIWVSWAREIYVLYEDTLGLRWELRPDAWVEGMPDRMEELAPPEGLHQPMRGFDIVWEDQGKLIRARDRLGWAVAPESGYQARYQCDSTLPPTCFLSGPDGQTFALQPDGVDWYIWSGPAPAP